MKKTNMRRWASTWTLALVSLVSLLPPMSMSMPTITAAQQTTLASPQPVSTFTDLPSSAHETYKGSGLYTAPISQNMDIAIKQQEQSRYANFGITPESAPGLALGSIYLKDATNNKYVELALYERAAYTAFDNAPAPQILSTIIYEGKVQVSDTEFIELPSSVKAAFLKLLLAGEGDASTPSVGQMAELMASRADQDWQTADKMLDAQGKLSNFDIQSHFPNMTSEQAAQYTLGKADPSTGHKTPDVITQGLAKMFGEQVIENAGLPKGPAVWISAKINGAVTPVLFQQYERMALTVNPNNADSPSKVTGDMKDSKNKSVVQVGLQGQIVYNGLLAVDTRPTATPTVQATATARPPEASPTVAPAGVEKVAGKEWFGGYQMEWQLDDGRRIGWSNPEKGRQDLEKNLMLMLVAQGRYGGSVEEVENTLKHNPVIDLDIPVYDHNVPGNYLERSPTLVTAATVKWDTSKPMIFKKDAAPFDNQIRMGDSRFYVGLLTNGINQLTYIVSPNYPFSEPRLASQSLALNILTEAAAKIKDADKYPKMPFEKTDFLNVAIISKFGTNYDPSYPYATNPNDFAQVNEAKTAYSYLILGLNH